MFSFVLSDIDSRMCREKGSEAESGIEKCCGSGKVWQDNEWERILDCGGEVMGGDLWCLKLDAQNASPEEPGGWTNVALHIVGTGLFVSNQRPMRKRKWRFIVEIRRDFERVF